MSKILVRLGLKNACFLKKDFVCIFIQGGASKLSSGFAAACSRGKTYCLKFWSPALNEDDIKQFVFMNLQTKSVYLRAGVLCQKTFMLCILINAPLQNIFKIRMQVFVF